LQSGDDQFYSLARQVSVRNYQLIDLDWAQAPLALKNIIRLREKLVILELQIAIGQRF
jgi:hypothetical protein